MVRTCSFDVLLIQALVLSLCEEHCVTTPAIISKRRLLSIEPAEASHMQDMTRHPSADWHFADTNDDPMNHLEPVTA